MLEWTPFEDGLAGKPFVPIDRLPWFNVLFDFGTKDPSHASNEVEANIIPALIEHLFIPRMRTFIQKVWEESSLRHARYVYH